MNHIVIIGRLTKDPELRYTPNGVAVATFTVAVDRPVKQGKEKEADFIPTVTWQKLAENCTEYLRKGRMVAVEGRLQIRSYDAQDGQKRRVAEIVARNVQFLEKSTGSAQGPPVTDDIPEDFGDINLDDLPF